MVKLLVGQLLLAKGDVEQAFNAFKIVLDGDRDNVPALLGQVFELFIHVFKTHDQQFRPSSLVVW